MRPPSRFPLGAKGCGEGPEVRLVRLEPPLMSLRVPLERADAPEELLGSGLPRQDLHGRAEARVVCHPSTTSPPAINTAEQKGHQQRFSEIFAPQTWH